MIPPVDENDDYDESLIWKSIENADKIEAQREILGDGKVFNQKVDE